MKVVIKRNTDDREYPVIGVSIAQGSGEIIKVHPDHLVKNASGYLPDDICRLLDMLTGESQDRYYGDTALFNKKSVGIVSLDIIVQYGYEEFSTIKTVPMDNKIQYLIMRESPLEGDIREEAIQKMKRLFEEPYRRSRQINNILGLGSIKDIVEYYKRTTPYEMLKVQGIGKKTREDLMELYWVYEYAYSYVYGGK